ncbi:hypothetical protein ZIOFF_040184 [Zingiber officinale]|uniref:Leucine-rich repeat-containing N-terminal plant-type domain-containing protein n=1 Tax=Zingiber officinale TaxID=94328 RepID=A0A8J5G4N8_ZINOF|nr:hypothetical protein ZIOFF_040184 [Zingiber officinale]
MPPHSFYFPLMLCWLMSLAFSFKEAAVATPTVGCSEVERDALLAFKANVKDPSRRLASWSPRIDCCKWSGVVCRVNIGCESNCPSFGLALRSFLFEFLDLNYVNLSRVSQSWLSDVNMVPSLQELYLEECDLNCIPSSFTSHLNLTSLVFRFASQEETFHCFLVLQIEELQFD